MARDRPRAARRRRTRIGPDDAGQMMILTAVILLLGFVALAGMVSRVSQLGSQTAIESERIILREVGPLGDSMDAAICKLKDSTLAPRFATVATTANSATVTATGATPPDFLQRDVGMVVAGTGILPGTRIVAVASATSATLSAPATATAGITLRFSPCVPAGTAASFGLSPATSPTLDDAVASAMEHFQALQASHGLFMDWSIGCIGGDPLKGRVTANLWDGTVWVEVNSGVAFPRASCSSVTG